MRDVERKLEEKAPAYREILDLFRRVLAQKRNDKNKIYSLYEPEVCCISKGKEHKHYEYGNKFPSVGQQAESLSEHWALGMNMTDTRWINPSNKWKG